MTAEVQTFGCRLNAYESEVIRTLAAGQSDLVVINTCAVTAEAERQCRAAVRRAHRDRPEARIVVTGCAAQINPAAWAALPGVHRVLGNPDKLRPASWQPSAGSAVSDLRAPRPDVPHPATGMEGRARAFVEVQSGCDHACTFCVIPQGRGPNRSVPPDSIVRQVRTLVDAGYQEVVLTGVDICSYGLDLPGRPTLGSMARHLLTLAPDLPRLRLSSLDPAALDEDLWRLLAEEPRLMPHLHLSLQAGSDLVLKRMRRRHTRAGALAAIARARSLRPGLTVGADLIAGFPTETDALFAETLAFVDEAALPYLHVFPYSERPGTPAARMPAVAPPVRRERAARLRAAASVHAAAFHAGMVGHTVQVVVERGGRGHTEHYAPVRLTTADAVGSLATALIVGADAAGLDAVGPDAASPPGG
ncbi:MAG: tRNA (N(6)-L-threonylcarbamoyladenosine(37)-C(2))-methylthiotransferase MtaB [Janthinobacterium lividum]